MLALPLSHHVLFSSYNIQGTKETVPLLKGLRAFGRLELQVSSHHLSGQLTTHFPHLCDCPYTAHQPFS